MPALCSLPSAFTGVVGRPGSSAQRRAQGNRYTARHPRHIICDTARSIRRVTLNQHDDLP
jgi:hypothetical protein